MSSTSAPTSSNSSAAPTSIPAIRVAPTSPTRESESPPAFVLTPRLVPVCATETRFCPKENGKFLLTVTGNKNTAASSIQIKDGKTKTIIFTCSSPQNRWRRIWEEKVFQCDGGGDDTSLTLRRKLLTVADQHVLLLSSGTAQEKELCRFFNGSVPPRNKAKIVAEFADTLRKDKKRILHLKGRLENKNCTIYLGDPKKEGERVIARMTNRHQTGAGGSTGGGEFIIEVAGGVDITVIMSMCIILAEYKYKSPKPGVVPLK